MKLCWTALVLSLLGAAAGVEEGGRETYITLALDWAMNWGEWGVEEFCPAGTFTYGFEIKVESEGATDDTSVNGIMLYCGEVERVGSGGLSVNKEARVFTITSNVEKWGEWRGLRECPEGLLTGLRMKSEEDQGALGDDTASNDLEMQCDHSTTTLNGGGNRWGHYSSWESCPEGWAICGLQTRVEDENASDDTALNDVRMFCCELPDVSDPATL